MDLIEQLIERVQKTQHGFTHIKLAAERILASHSSAVSLELAKRLFESRVHQAGVLATFLFGARAAESKAA